MNKVRENFGLASRTINADYKDFDANEAYKGSLLERDKVRPVVLEGAELLDTLCPVSHNTGRRENPLSLLGKLTGADSQILNAVLQELPTIQSNSKLTDEDRVAWLTERCSTGTPAEDALMAERLMKDLDALGISQQKVDEIQKNADNTISFDNADVPKSE